MTLENKVIIRKLKKKKKKIFFKYFKPCMLPPVFARVCVTRMVLMGPDPQNSQDKSCYLLYQ